MEDSAGIPEDLRCKRSDGKQWRCSAPSMPDKTVCEKHYIQAKKRAANSALRASLKKARRKSLDDADADADADIYLERKHGQLGLTRSLLPGPASARLTTLSPRVKSMAAKTEKKDRKKGKAAAAAAEAEGGHQKNPISEGGRRRKEEEEEGRKEGRFLLGPPTFADTGNGRWRCAESAHEMVAKDKDSYARSKACRLALIDAALAAKKPPLNTFQPHPTSKSQLICKLTGDTINKTEEHIWKHITGKRFLNKLEQMEVDNMALEEAVEKEKRKNKKNSKKPSKSLEAVAKKNKKKDVSDNVSLTKTTIDDDSKAPDFWIPPIGSRWDFDDGKDRWKSCPGPDQEMDDAGDFGEGGQNDDSESELAIRTKRMSVAVGPSSFASRKKKIKKAAN